MDHRRWNDTAINTTSWEPESIGISPKPPVRGWRESSTPSRRNFGWEARRRNRPAGTNQPPSHCFSKARTLWASQDTS